MFNLFGKKDKLPVTAEDKDWIEGNIAWLIKIMGIPAKPFYKPVFEEFPYTDLYVPAQFEKLFTQLCGLMGVDADCIEVRFFDDLKSNTWTTWAPEGKFSHTAGLYSHNTTNDKPFNIQLAKSNLHNATLMVSVLAHELMHVKLLGGNYVNIVEADMEPFTDLAVIYHGFGIFMAESAETKDAYYVSRTGYLPDEVIAYACALCCYITNDAAGQYTQYFTGRVKPLFEQSFAYLTNTGNTLLTKEHVAKCHEFYTLDMAMREHMQSNNLQAQVQTLMQLLNNEPKNIGILNNIGYVYILMKEYNTAIEWFDKAAATDPHWDQPFSNRGYARLQLGNYDDAFTDLFSAHRMNPDNPYTLRNLGAFYLGKKEYGKALNYFEAAIKIDPATEMINFYLAHAYQQLNNVEKAKGHLAKSQELNEYNDSILAIPVL